MLADCADTFLEQVCTCKTVQPTSKQKQQQRQQQQQQHRQPKFGDFFFKAHQMSTWCIYLVLWSETHKHRYGITGQNP